MIRCLAAFPESRLKETNQLLQRVSVLQQSQQGREAPEFILEQIATSMHAVKIKSSEGDHHDVADFVVCSSELLVP